MHGTATEEEINSKEIEEGDDCALFEIGSVKGVVQKTRKATLS